MATNKKKKSRIQTFNPEKKDGKSVIASCGPTRMHKCLQAYLDTFRENASGKTQDNQ